MPPIPHYLTFITVILVVIPSVITIFLRFKLYQHLVSLEEKVRRLINRQSRGQQPKILEELESRFQQASNNLDQVNTVALIDQVYSREKINGFTCEQIDYWCRILPNLLLAFGLLGTFFGITSNLAEISQTINQNNSNNVNDLVSALNKPLEGMSIAFVTSLTGLLFSSILTVFNWLKNTGFAKYRLISSLEDYLDNIYQPEIQGDTRLDKIVNRMVSQQDEFLTRFGSTVRDAVEQSLGNVAKQIAQGNKEASDLAKQVYESFYQAAGTISTAASEFDHSIQELNAKSQIFKQSAEIFERSQFPQQLSAATADLSSIQLKFSQSATSLADTVKSFATVLSEVQSCNQELIKIGLDIQKVNQTSLQVFDLHQSNQDALTEIIPQLKQGTTSFSRAINKLGKLEERIVDKADSFNTVEVTLRELLLSVNQYTEKANSGLSNVSKKLEDNNLSVNNLVSNVEELIKQITFDLNTLINEIHSLQNSNNALFVKHEKVGDHLIEAMNKLNNINNNTFVYKDVNLSNDHS
ncbi:hypothetical protein Ava_1849 [Trichormus variabilis ATCC 29413]|uniref:MotA/TolQ/ExbB proton channel domain-containing protein n=3 Tax=Anabaena variabilis TaxID=264691 RepID=Q3MC15_TRIV2|nr:MULTISPECIES: hypothetical protein [Nostocaceae]ABA21471.1 hypothetical protein Ava_1849 [Trichormus variabilis ATCC 29413]MBC1213338.1 hypothetical protein [Trichormus variabilis ARAD]MBC1301139.1 hypothetical protein [Trichormus variabilis N2B]MBC1311417.1 hypothetical protein [Trichormus variabilis PNB]MBC1327342.1 hypothetical protein [Trichormus variabilis 9RC]